MLALHFRAGSAAAFASIWRQLLPGPRCVDTDPYGYTDSGQIWVVVWTSPEPRTVRHGLLSTRDASSSGPVPSSLNLTLSIIEASNNNVTLDSSAELP